MEIIVRKSKPRIDMYDPEHTDPTWKRAHQVGQERIQSGKLKFADKVKRKMTGSQ